MSKPGDPAGEPSWEVLVVDDEQALLTAYSTVLRAAGHRIELAEDGEVARELVQKRSFDVILSDINMPGMDGGDVSKALHAHPEVRTIPVLFLTALISPSELKQTGQQIGGRPAISKQAPLEELAKRVQQLIDRKA